MRASLMAASNQARNVNAESIVETNQAASTDAEPIAEPDQTSQTTSPPTAPPLCSLCSRANEPGNVAFSIAREPDSNDIANALTMLARLPLDDSERTEAVRALLAARHAIS